LDPVVLALVSPRKMNFMAKEELFNNPLFGYLISRLGAFPLRRDRIDRRAYQKALMVLREGKILALFPEGTRSLSGRLGDLKEGSVKIAIHCKVPLIPVVIRGTGKVLPPGAKIIKPGKIKVKVGDPISPYNSGKKKKASEVLQRLKEEMIKMGAEK
ncbi:1-acyl-sn-glycerol-3-phosphate acyltransferase, partial [Candidatus Aerophobetes bacterium]